HHARLPRRRDLLAGADAVPAEAAGDALGLHHKSVAISPSEEKRTLPRTASTSARTRTDIGSQRLDRLKGRFSSANRVQSANLDIHWCLHWCLARGLDETARVNHLDAWRCGHMAARSERANRKGVDNRCPAHRQSGP